MKYGLKEGAVRDFNDSNKQPEREDLKHARSQGS